MIDTDLNSAVHDLLMKSRNAHDGAQLAREAMNVRAARELEEKARTLVREALEVDPKRESPAWNDKAEMVAGLEKRGTK